MAATGFEAQPPSGTVPVTFLESSNPQLSDEAIALYQPKLLLGVAENGSAPLEPDTGRLAPGAVFADEISSHPTQRHMHESGDCSDLNVTSTAQIQESDNNLGERGGEMKGHPSNVAHLPSAPKRENRLVDVAISPGILSHNPFRQCELCKTLKMKCMKDAGQDACQRCQVAETQCRSVKSEDENWENPHVRPRRGNGGASGKAIRTFAKDVSTRAKTAYRLPAGITRGVKNSSVSRAFKTLVPPRRETTLAGRFLDALNSLVGVIPPGRGLTSEAEVDGTVPRQNEPHEADTHPTHHPQTPAEEQAPKPPPGTIVSSTMSAAEIITVLKGHGCVDITHQLDLPSCSSYAISNGGFGDVYSGRLLDGTPVAIKVFRFQIVQLEGRGGKHLKYAAKELHTWSKCQHPNVLGLLGLVEFRGQIGMVSRWMNYGSLRMYLDQHPDADRYQLCYDICDGLAYLHEIGIIHGDLKGANVLISEDGTALLADFGNSLLSHPSLMFTQSNGNPTISLRWTAPEILVGSVVLSYEADVFSLGMTLLETITGEVPYHEIKSDPTVMFTIAIHKKIPARPEALSGDDNMRGHAIWNLLRSSWAFEPERRPKAMFIRDRLLSIFQTKDGSRSPPSTPQTSSPRESNNGSHCSVASAITNETTVTSTKKGNISSDDFSEEPVVVHESQNPKRSDANLLPGSNSDATNLPRVTPSFGTPTPCGEVDNALQVLEVMSNAVDSLEASSTLE